MTLSIGAVPYRVLISLAGGDPLPISEGRIHLDVHEGEVFGTSITVEPKALADALRDAADALERAGVAEVPA